MKLCKGLFRTTLVQEIRIETNISLESVRVSQSSKFGLQFCMSVHYGSSCLVLYPSSRRIFSLVNPPDIKYIRYAPNKQSQRVALLTLR